MSLCSNKLLNSYLVLAVTAAVQGNLHAAEWTTRAGVDPGLIFTDNYCLEDENEQSEWITTITPNMNVEGNGSRASFTFAGAFEFNDQDDKSDNCRGSSNNTESFNPRFNTSANAELLENLLFFDANANASQNQVDAFRAGGNDGINGRGNTNTSYNWSVSPYLQRRVQRTADVELRYTYDEQSNTEDSVEDSQAHRGDLKIDSVPGTSSLDWSVVGSYDDISYDEQENIGLGETSSELISAELILGYTLTRRWRVYGSVGEDWNDFQSFDDDTDGSFWTVGFDWTPSERTSLSVGSGDRFFGNTPSVDFSHRSRRSVITANYAKVLTYTRDFRSDDGQFPNEDPFGNPIDPLDNEGIPLFGSPTTQARSPVVDERATLRYDLKGKRSTLGFSANYSEQDRLDIGEVSTFITLALSATRNLSRYTTFRSSISFQDTENDERVVDVIDDDAQTWRGSAAMERRLTDKLSVSLNYQYTDRDSDLDADDYTENRLILNLRYTF